MRPLPVAHRATGSSRTASRRRPPDRALRRRADERRRGAPNARSTRCCRVRPAASTAPPSWPREPGFDRILTFDMGGTSTDVAVFIDGEPTITRETAVGDVPGAGAVARRARAIGAGGGSIADVSRTSPARCASDRTAPAPTRARPATAAAAPSRPSPTPTWCSATCRRPARRRHGARRRRGAAGRGRGSASPLGARRARGRRRASSTSSTRSCSARCASSPCRAGSIRATSRSSPSAAPGGSTPTRWPRCSAASRCSCRRSPACCRRSASWPPRSRTSSARPTSATPRRSTADELRARLAALAEQADELARGRARRGRPSASVDYVVDMRYQRQGFEIPIDIAAGELAELTIPSADRALRRRAPPSLRLRPGRRSELVSLRAVARGGSRSPEIPSHDRRPGRPLRRAASARTPSGPAAHRRTCPPTTARELAPACGSRVTRSSSSTTPRRSSCPATWPRSTTTSTC